MPLPSDPTTAVEPKKTSDSEEEVHRGPLPDIKLNYNMPTKAEDTPFAIDFKQSNITIQANYGTTLATTSQAAALLPHPNPISIHTTNNNNSHDSSTDLSNLPSSPSTIYCLHGQTNVEVRDHCHRQRSEGVDVNARKKLIIASILCLFFMICEIIGGVLSNSLAIATDAAHLLTDFASFMISLFAIWIAGRPSTQRMSFGWYRAEVIGALASVVMIWFITAILVWLAVERLINGNFEVNAPIMLITSGLAILVNLIMGCQLQHGHTHGGGFHSHEIKKAKKKSAARETNDSDPTGIMIVSSEKPQRLESLVPSVKLRSSATSLSDSSTSYLDVKIGKPGSVVDAHKPLSKTEQESVVNERQPSAEVGHFSYQNSKSVNEVQAEIAAVMADNASVHHQHGSAANREAVNLNVRAAFIHVLGDILQSIGVFVAALVIYFRPDWAIADPICTFVFSIIVLCTTFSIMKDALLVLMEGTPNYMHYTEVLNIFKQIDGVQRVHNLRIWALSINKVALSVHLAIAPNADPKDILKQATSAVHLRYNFFETTIQIEDFTPEMENCTQCSVPQR